MKNTKLHSFSKLVIGLATLSLYFVLYSLYFVPSIFAHVLETGSTVGAVLHIDPEDDPIIGQPANFYFEFKDTENKFDLSKCECKVVIKKNDQEIFNGNLEFSPGSSSGISATFSYTFPEKGSYLVEVDGDPIHPNDFSEFGLSYNLNLSREKNLPQVTNTPIPSIWWQNYSVHLLGVGTVLIFFLGLLIMQKVLKR